MTQIWYNLNITDLTACGAAGISRRDFGRAFWEPKTILSCHRFVARDFFSIACRPHVAARAPLPSIAVRSSRERQGTFDPRACHIRNTGAAISGPWLRNESLLIFTWRFAHARTPTCTALKIGEREKVRDEPGPDPFESIGGGRNGTSRESRVAVPRNSRVVPYCVLRDSKPRLPRY